MPRALIVGSGGREHALALALARSQVRPQIFVAPGNAGIARVATCVEIAATDVEGLTRFAEDKAIDLVIVGPEAPLVLGLADRLRERAIPVLGPSKAAARLEGSKSYSKAIMEEAEVPTARGASFTEAEPAIAYARSLGGRAVVKADGLAAGKGVVVADDLREAEAAIRAILGGAHGRAGDLIVVEERLDGEEVSVIALCDGERLAVLAPAQDHKRIFDGDRGPNTGGMGAYSPAPRATGAVLDEIETRCMRPIIEVMRRKKTPFSGFLFAGLMLTDAGPKVLEYNVRFGDPEAEAILPRMTDDPWTLFESAAKGALAGERVAFSSSAAMTIVVAAEGYPADPTKGDPIDGLEEAEAIAIVHHAGTKEDRGRIVTAGGRVLAVTGLGANLEQAAETAYRAVGKIRFRGMQYRKDIGHRAIGRAIG